MFYIIKGNFVDIMTQCCWCDDSFNWDYFLTCAHACAELNSDQNLIQAQMAVQSWTEQCVFRPEPRWCNKNCDWTKVKVEFELG